MQPHTAAPQFNGYSVPSKVTENLVGAELTRGVELQRRDVMMMNSVPFGEAMLFIALSSRIYCCASPFITSNI